jgi:hypothetical protein
MQKMIQHSALYSWKTHNVQIFAPLNEVGLKEATGSYENVTFIPDVKRGREIGFNTQAPIVKDLLIKALPLINTPMIAMINSDIIITDNFIINLEKIFVKYGFDVFMVGSRSDVKLNYMVNSPETYRKFQEEPRKFYDNATSSDIFITSKFLWRKIAQEMPEFIFGRICWDNWMHLYGELHVGKKYNCTKVLPILHCEHGHEHIKAQEGIWGKDAPSSQHNLKLWMPIQNEYGCPRINHWPSVEL